MEIVSWQTVLTDHQIHTLSALKRLPEVALKVVIGQEELAERKEQGWMKPDWGHLDTVSFDRGRWFQEGAEFIRANLDAVHLFSGLWADRRFFLLLLYAAWKRCKIGLVTEPFSDTADGYLSNQSKIKGRLFSKIRPIIYGLAGKLLSKRIGPIFAISPKAVKQFANLGFNEKYIYPFGYFIPADRKHKVKSSNKPGYLRIIYVGALISRKGLDCAFQSVSYCADKGLPVELHVYGPGNPADFKGFEHPQIKYCGRIPFGQAQSVIANYDLLVVPSYYDGWAVVINEALLQNVPVLSSSNVGASVLLESSGAGAIFESGNYRDLAKHIQSAVIDGAILDRWRQNAMKFAAQLSSEVAAKYMLQCLNAYRDNDAKPFCPWY